jgi:MFS family permease
MKKNEDCNDVDYYKFANQLDDNENKFYSMNNYKLNDNFINKIEKVNEKDNLNSRIEKFEVIKYKNEYNNCENEKLLVSFRIHSDENLNINKQTHQQENKNDKNSDNLKSTLDIYIDKIGFNRFQLITLFIVCFIFFVEGSEMVIINLILTSIQKDWKISTIERSLLSSAIFFGFFLGSLISGYLLNKYGRKTPCIYSVFIVWIFSVLAPLVESFSHLFIIRIFVGLGFGVLVPALTSLVTELIPTYNRSFVLNMLWVLYPVGIVYICVISLFNIKNKQFLDWKQISLINSYSSALMTLFALFLPESPRHLLLKREYKKAFEILNIMGKPNNISLTEIEEEKIILEYQLLEESNKSTSNFDISIFTTKRYLKVSILLSYLWFIKSLISYGLLYILPKIFDSMSTDKRTSLKSMIYSMLILIGCPIFRGLISEIQSLGRKKSMILGLVGALITCSFCIISSKYISMSSGLFKFFINSSLGIISVYTSEVYPTNARGIALGFGNGITKLGGILTPFICEFVENTVPKGPFWLYVFLSLTGIITLISLPFETMGMSLDQIPEGVNKFNRNEENEILIDSNLNIKNKNDLIISNKKI